MDQARLADARLADDRGHLPFALARALEQGQQLLDLAAAPDERRRRRAEGTGITPDEAMHSVGAVADAPHLEVALQKRGGGLAEHDVVARRRREAVERSPGAQPGLLVELARRSHARDHALRGVDAEAEIHERRQPAGPALALH